jgi:glycosyltransferase involved in cell wall biosynthesis
VPRIAYQGDVDFRPAEARLRDSGLFGPGDGTERRGPLSARLERVRQRLWLRGFKGAHWRLMRDANVIANVTASNADYYRRRGHPRSIYVQNTWSDDGADGRGGDGVWPAPTARGRPAKIIGHVGHLHRTGSTYGLKFLLVDLLPRLAEVMRGLEYEIHIIGGGEVAPALRSWLGQKRILLRGFVEDLDAEMRSSDMFLLLNNAGSYHAAYTRHLVAWSLGLCLVAHANSRLAIPEIAHMENALVGSTPGEIAEMVRLAATDPDLNLRLRKGGRATYERYFTPTVVAEALTREITQIYRAT